MSNSSRDRFFAGSDVPDVSDSDRDRFFPLANVLVITAGNQILGVYTVRGPHGLLLSRSFPQHHSKLTLFTFSDKIYF